LKFHALSGKVTLAAATFLASSAVAATPAMAKTLYVSASHGSDTNSCTSKRKPCATISGAVSKAGRRDQIRVASGTYAEQVTVNKDLKLVGVGHPVIDATSHINGILIQGAGAAGTSVSGFTAENALNEGILAQRTSRVKIFDNLVEDNDQGSSAPPAGDAECAPTDGGNVPGDCGEGLHLFTVANSKVTGNTVKDNSGGILLTDELGPTHGNVISHNRVRDNVTDCGITIASHSTTAYVNGKLQRHKGGIYNNVISHNLSAGNGTAGAGAGILMASPTPGGAVYDNTVTRNTVTGNGQGGFVLHSRLAGQFFNGNKVIANRFSNNGALGDTPTSGDSQKTGIIVWSAVTKIKKLTVSGNRISDEYYGIWTDNAPKIKKSRNKFRDVTVDIFQS
jgi:parallel beta-helix repeat protein